MRWPGWLPRRLGHVVGLAAAYYVAGRLGLLLAIPPGYATAVWPAAGIALAAVLLLGYRVWPGVLLGSFLVNVGTSLDTSTTATLLKSLAVATSIGTGAAAQACLGALLVRRFIGFPTSLDGEREVVRLLVLGALGSLVSATVGVATLLVSGVIPPHLVLFSWWTWWVGDTIGIIILTPLILIWATTQEAWQRRRAAVTWPLAALSLLVILLFVRASNWEQERVEREFRERATRLARGVERTLAADLEVLESVRDFAASSPGFDRRAFQSFAEGALARAPGLSALSWDLRVPGPQRSAVESAARREGHAGFEVWEQNAKGEQVRAGRRDEHVVVYYIAPEQGNASALGLDVAAESARRRALTLARDLNRPIASSPIGLVQGTGRGFIVVRPVFAAGLPYETIEERRRYLVGYATAVVRIADLVQTPVRELDDADIELRLYDETAPGTQRLLYVHPRSAGATIRQPKAGQASRLGMTSAFELAGRRWIIQVAPWPRYLAAGRAWEAWAVLAAGLLFTGLLGAFLLVITGRATRVELLVAQRTADLARSNEAVLKLASIVESSSDAIIGKTLDGTIVSWNAGAEATYGYTLEEARDRHISLLHPRVAKEKSPIFDRVRAGDRLSNLETVNITKDGRLIDVSLTVSPIRDATGQVVGVSTIARDVTERKALERMKDEFVGTVSHELRTPLAAIKGFVELVADGEAGPVTDTQREFLEISARNADRLTALINDLLDVNRMESSGLEMREDPVDLAELLGEVAATFRLAAEAKGLEFRTEPAELPRILGDRERLIQVFNNLVSNAIKYTPAGWVGISGCVREAEVEIVVHDTGIGLSSEEQAHLFTRFFRGGHRVAREAGGTGLGLVIAKAIVQRHGGRIAVESEPGTGTRFRVFLPLPSRASADSPAAA